MTMAVINESPIWQLEDVENYIKNVLGVRITKIRLIHLYNMISNPQVRVNTRDKQWVAITQPYEISTVLDAIKQIVNTPNLKDSSFENTIIEAINEVGSIFSAKNIKDKHRIPFYVLVLDNILKQ